MSEKFRAAAQQEDRPFMQTAARISGRIYKVRTELPFPIAVRRSVSS